MSELPKNCYVATMYPLEKPEPINHERDTSLHCLPATVGCASCGRFYEENKRLRAALEVFADRNNLHYNLPEGFFLDLPYGEIKPHEFAQRELDRTN